MNYTHTIRLGGLVIYRFEPTPIITLYRYRLCDHLSGIYRRIFAAASVDAKQVAHMKYINIYNFFFDIERLFK